MVGCGLRPRRLLPASRPVGGGCALWHTPSSSPNTCTRTRAQVKTNATDAVTHSTALGSARAFQGAATHLTISMLLAPQTEVLAPGTALLRTPTVAPTVAAIATTGPTSGGGGGGGDGDGGGGDGGGDVGEFLVAPPPSAEAVKQQLEELYRAAAPLTGKRAHSVMSGGDGGESPPAGKRARSGSGDTATFSYEEGDEADEGGGI
jgi:hypothetical protein